MSTKTKRSEKSKSKSAPAQVVPVTPVPAGRTQLLALTPEQAQAVARLKENRAKLAELKKLVDADTDVIKAVAGTTALVGTYEGTPVVRFGDGAWNGTDDKLLKEAFPEAFGATRLTKPYVTVSPL